MQDLKVVFKQISDAYDKNFKHTKVTNNMVENDKVMKNLALLLGAMKAITYLQGFTTEQEWQEFLKGDLAK